jgi:hypothetical protein
VPATPANYSDAGSRIVRVSTGRIQKEYTGAGCFRRQRRISSIVDSCMKSGATDRKRTGKNIMHSLEIDPRGSGSILMD